MLDEVSRYLERSVAPEVGDVRAVRLRMRGEIRLKDRWMPFSADHWIAPHVGFEWRATIRMGPVPIKGFDRYSEGRGELCWRLFGLVPMVRETGPDIDRSARGRLAAEAVFVPGALAPRHGVTWSKGEGDWVRARWTIDGSLEELQVELDPHGRPKRIQNMRWGNPDGEGWREIPFGGSIEEEGTFSGLTVPTLLSVGWWFGTVRYREEGEFFRARIEGVTLSQADL